METATLVVTKRKQAEGVDGGDPVGGSVELRLDAGTAELEEAVVALVVADEETFRRLPFGALVEVTFNILEQEEAGENIPAEGEDAAAVVR